MNKETLKTAHKHSSNNKNELAASDLCGCFYCKEIFSPKEIKEYANNNQTALCPYCFIDSLIGNASGYELTKEFMEEMNDFWFNTVVLPTTGKRYKYDNITKTFKELEKET